MVCFWHCIWCRSMPTGKSSFRPGREVINFAMPRLDRIIMLDERQFRVPQYVNRTVSGWQVRVRGVASRHYADAHYESSAHALKAASQEVNSLLVARKNQLNAFAEEKN